MIRVKDYNHIGIVVKDLKKCRWFYEEVLGLTTIERPPFNFPGHWYQVGNHTELHLMVYDEEIPETMRHVALEVEDFDETLKHLEANGIEIVDGPGKRVDESDYLFCRDPDGNLVEITRHQGVFFVIHAEAGKGEQVKKRKGEGYGGKVLVADHHAAVMEGSPEKVIVILQFPSADVARQWYDSPEYREVKHLRTSTTEGWLLIADEFVEPGE